MVPLAGNEAGYRVTAQNADQCPSGGAFIKTEAACKGAAAAYGKRFVSSSTAPNWPKGCFYLQTHDGVWFNNNLDAPVKAEQNSQLLCEEAQGGAPFGDKAGYHATAQNAAQCPSDAAFVETKAACEGAAAAYGKRFVSSSTAPNWPRGCFYLQTHDGVWFNDNLDAPVQAEQSSQLLCEKRPGARSLYTMGASGAGECRGGGPIATELGCDAAAKALGFGGGVEQAAAKTGWPRGCSVYGGKAYFNTSDMPAEEGAAGHMVVCTRYPQGRDGEATCPGKMAGAASQQAEFVHIRDSDTCSLASGANGMPYSGALDQGAKAPAGCFSQNKAQGYLNTSAVGNPGGVEGDRVLCESSYRLEDDGAPNCEEGTSHITKPGPCQKAAEAWGLQYGGEQDHGENWPKGCFVYDDTVWLNKTEGNVGSTTGLEGHSLLCRTDPPKVELADGYKRQEPDATKCPPAEGGDTFVAVETNDVCQAAAASDMEEVDYADKPKGCFIEGGRLYFNVNEEANLSGKAPEGITPVCIRKPEEEPEPEPEPDPLPPALPDPPSVEALRERLEKAYANYTAATREWATAWTAHATAGGTSLEPNEGLRIANQEFSAALKELMAVKTAIETEAAVESERASALSASAAEATRGAGFGTIQANLDNARGRMAASRGHSDDAKFRYNIRLIEIVLLAIPMVIILGALFFGGAPVPGEAALPAKVEVPDVSPPKGDVPDMPDVPDVSPPKGDVPGTT